MRKRDIDTPLNLELALGRLQPVVKPIEESSCPKSFSEDLRDFTEFGTSTKEWTLDSSTVPSLLQPVPVYCNEFWTAKQRQAHSLHEVSYRACFKPQLPRFFIERLTRPGDRVYDPFMGRGTTPLEASLLGRIPCGCDANPVSLLLCRPRLNPPALSKVKARIEGIDLTQGEDFPADLLVFYHPETLRQITALRRYFRERRESNTFDGVDAWLEMVSLNRLTGHSNGFFSVYTLPPNQATSAKAQRRINERRNQTPPIRDIPAIILKKSKQLLQEVYQHPPQHADKALLVNRLCHDTPEIPAGSINLVVTSPPFLNVVNYAGDNWLRCWFAGIDMEKISLTVVRKLEDWAEAMTAVFHELHRVLVPGGHIAFEVGEIHLGKTLLEETVLTCATAAGLTPVLLMINDQEFTKTANCWGVTNNEGGTNTNRIVLLRRD